MKEIFEKFEKEISILKVKALEGVTFPEIKKAVIEYYDNLFELVNQLKSQILQKEQELKDAWMKDHNQLVGKTGQLTKEVTKFSDKWIKSNNENHQLKKDIEGIKRLIDTIGCSDSLFSV